MKWTKNSAIVTLVIISLIIGAAGAGIGTYSFIILYKQNPGNPILRATYFSQHNDSVFLPATTQHYIDELLIDFEIFAGESVYFLYTSTVALMSTYDNFVQFVIQVDGGKTMINFATIQVNDVSGAEDYAFPIAIQGFANTLTVGQHNVTVSIYSDAIAFDNFVLRQALLVQIFTT
ncbi:MAG: hypothetical protein ACTSPT_06820 [Candidatus Heimdallarchaeota archaeon]